MQHGLPPTVTTDELLALLARPAGLWLVYAPDVAQFADGHIPGSLSSPGLDLLDVLAASVPVVAYGEDRRATVAKDLTLDLNRSQTDRARWYSGGLAAWQERDLPVDTAHSPGS